MLGSLIAGIASGEMFAALKRARGAAIAYLIAGLFALVGLGFLIGAGYVAAARRWGTIEAALGFGIGFLVLAGIVVLIHVLTRRARANRIARQRSVDVATIAGAAAVSLLPLLLRRKGGIGVGGLLAPLIAVAAYAIYREHGKTPPDDPES